MQTRILITAILLSLLISACRKTEEPEVTYSTEWQYRDAIPNSSQILNAKANGNRISVLTDRRLVVLDENYEHSFSSHLNNSTSYYTKISKNSAILDDRGSSTLSYVSIFPGMPFYYSWLSLDRIDSSLNQGALNNYDYGMNDYGQVLIQGFTRDSGSIDRTYKHYLLSVPPDVNQPLEVEPMDFDYPYSKVYTVGENFYLLVDASMTEPFEDLQFNFMIVNTLGEILEKKDLGYLFHFEFVEGSDGYVYSFINNEIQRSEKNEADFETYASFDRNFSGEHYLIYDRIFNERLDKISVYDISGTDITLRDLGITFFDDKHIVSMFYFKGDMVVVCSNGIYTMPWENFEGNYL